MRKELAGWISRDWTSSSESFNGAFLNAPSCVTGLAVEPITRILYSVQCTGVCKTGTEYGKRNTEYRNPTMWTQDVAKNEVDLTSWNCWKPSSVYSGSNNHGKPVMNRRNAARLQLQMSQSSHGKYLIQFWTFTLPGRSGGVSTLMDDCLGEYPVSRVHGRINPYFRNSAP